MKSTMKTHMHRAWSALAILLLPAMLMAQVSLYQWSETSGTYTPLTEADSPLILGQPEYWPHVFRNRAWVNNPFNDPGGQLTQSGYLNPAEGPGYPIGFDFSFNGDVFDVIGISNGGWISFGKSSDGLNAVWVYNWGGTQVGDPLHQPFYNPTPSYRRNRVAGFGNSGLQQVDWSSLMPPGPRSSVKVATIGTAPNRVCVVEWFDYGLSGDVTVAINLINFQIRLYEADNSVEVHFGNMDWVSTSGRYTRTQIGLGGRTNADYTGRMTVYEQPAFIYDWTNTVPMDTSNAVCTIAVPQPGMPNNSGIMPLEGTVWRWVMPVCPPPAWPQLVDEITFEGAHVTWESTDAGEWEYVLSTESDPNGPQIASDFTYDTEAWFEGLEPHTNYYFFVRSICGGEPGPWSMATPFQTIGGGVIDCDGTALDVTYCSHQHDTITWTYVSPTGSPLRIEFYDGFISSNTSDSFRIWASATTTGQPSWTMPAGNPAGHAVESPNGAMTLQLITEQGSCASQDWFLPFVWRIGCKDCSDPLVSYSVTEDCDNNAYYVDVDIFSMGSATELVLENSLGVAPTTVNATGVHSVGPFPAGQSVVVIARNADNVMCHSDSPTLLGLPCAEADCGPTEYTWCYGFNEFQNRAYQGENGQEIGVRFLAGSVGIGNTARWYNGLDTEEVVPTTISGGLMNQLLVSGAPSTDNAIVIEIQSGTTQSCLDEGPVQGYSGEWEYVVACYDGCIQPKATFTTSCVSPTQYEILVNITEVGSTGSVEITNTGGATSITAQETGVYAVGPFAHGTSVVVEVVGASILCTWTSPQLVREDCSDFVDAIGENDMGSLNLFPNPNNGIFTLELPEGLMGSSVLRVLDITGRTVASRQLHGAPRTEIDLNELPNGLYTILLENSGQTLNGRVSIQK